MGPTDEMTCSLPSGPPETLKKMMETTARSPSLFGAGLACGDRGAATTGTFNSSGAIEVCLCNGGGELAAPLPADITVLQKGLLFEHLSGLPAEIYSIVQHQAGNHCQRTVSPTPPALSSTIRYLS